MNILEIIPTEPFLDILTLPKYGKCIISFTEAPKTAIDALNKGRITTKEVFKVCHLVVSIDIGIYEKISDKQKEISTKEVKQLYIQAKNIYHETEHKVRLSFIRKRKYE